MLINLTKSVPLKELCKITAIGHTADMAEQIEFTFSHEAMLGFATELIWMYESIDDKMKSIMDTKQLRIDPAPNQVFGFYLTPDSPGFVLELNSLAKEKGDRDIKWKEINIREKNRNIFYNVKDPSDEDIEFNTLGAYELSRRNLVNIRVFDDEGNDITKGVYTVILKINREGIKDFATMLLVWADNYREGDEYVLPHIGKAEQGYNLGIILTHDSISGKFKAHGLGVANDYDSRF